MVIDPRGSGSASIISPLSLWHGIPISVRDDRADTGLRLRAPLAEDQHITGKVQKDTPINAWHALEDIIALRSGTPHGTAQGNDGR